MKKRNKIILSLILIFVFVFGSTFYCYANVGTGIFSLVDLVGKIISGDISSLTDFVNQTFVNSGLLAPSIDYQTLEDYVSENYPELVGNNENETKENVTDYLGTNISVSDNSVTFNDNSKTFFIDLVDYYKEQNKVSIWNCVSAPRTPSNILNNGFMTDAVPLMNQYGNSAYFILSGANNNSTYFYIVPKSNGMIYGVQSAAPSAKWHGFQLYRCKDLGGSLIYDPIYNRDEDNIVYSVANDGHLTLISDNSTIDSGYNSSIIGAYFVNESYQPAEDSNWRTYPKCFTMGVDTIQTFASASALDNYIHTVGIGLQPYYVNNSVWQDFSTSSGDYTFDNSNINTVTYGDTVSYVNDYHDTNNNYPDNSTVNNWINNTNNNNSGGGSGGGSGESGDDSGGSGIISILTALGKAIADLITGIAAFLAEVVGGLVEAITGLLDTLTDLITNFTESIPNIFSPLLGWLFDGLPEEFTAIILLGLTACVIASIIKILRG